MTSEDEKNPRAKVENIEIPHAESMEKGGASFDSGKRYGLLDFQRVFLLKSSSILGYMFTSLKRIPSMPVQRQRLHLLSTR